MKATKYTILAVSLITLNSLTVSRAEEYVDRAIVTDAQPVVETLYAPAADCQHSAYNRPARSDPTLHLLGALVGGAAGSAAGKGTGKDAAAALGAVIGSKVFTGDSYVSGEELLGAIAGGVVGNKVGRNSGKTAATAIGAVVGSALATGKLSRNPRDFQSECGKKVVSKKVITKYRVTYDYNGLSFTGELPYKPDEYVGVLVNVEVLEDRTL